MVMYREGDAELAAEERQHGKGPAADRAGYEVPIVENSGRDGLGAAIVTLDTEVLEAILEWGWSQM